MSKGQHLTSYQRGIVRRYYANLDTLALQKLGEAVGELYLATDAKRATRLWESVAKQLPKVLDDPAEVARIVAGRDVKSLAEVVNNAAGPGRR
ncbi:hypothetical protein J4558_13035 [Leptolyngbya sp. 15MV]|nr:hypothetical protein J4558_13035 [Leptolyngbya sp. 15MV]